MGDISRPIEREAIEKNIKEFLKQSTYKYAFINSKTPIYVTYYSSDYLNSTGDINLGGVNEIIGNNSPLKFNKISNFPLYNFPQLENNFSYDEMNGLVSDEIGGDAIILPTVLEPKAYDFFAIDLFESRFLFMVKDVASDRLEGDAFWKINFFLSEFSEDDIIKYNLNDKYVVETEHIGTGEQVILRDDTYKILREYQELNEELIKLVKKLFFIKNTSSIPLLKSSKFELPVYEPALLYLLVDKKLLESDLSFGGKLLHIYPPFYDKLSWINNIRFSIFGAAHSGWILNKTSESYMVMKNTPTFRDDIFYPDYAISGYYSANVIMRNSTKEIKETLFNPIVTEVESLMLTNHASINITNKLHDLTVLFLANKFNDVEDKKIIMQAILNAFRDDFPITEEDIYFYIPILMEACRKLQNDMVQNNFIRT